jgi:peptide/nickel transport system ATP-binding protein
MVIQAALIQVDMALLDVENLQTHFRTPDGIVRAVDGVSFAVERSETVAIVGESGSGKSVTANSILRLIPQPPGKIAGRIRFEGDDLLALPERAMRGIRGNRISMVFQEPMTSLNPVLTVGHQIAEPLRLHQRLGRRQVAERAVEMLSLVGIAEPRRRAAEYPHQLSGGMRQRVMIALALACNPRLLIADEPTTALDVTIQAQILDLMADLKRRVGAAIIIITHDLGVVAEIAERVIVMYAGRKVEEARVADLFRTPRHPYTQGLLAAVPRLGASLGASLDASPGASLAGGAARLAEIPGTVPSLKQRIAGCVFASRCAQARDVCREVAPALEEKAAGHVAACHFAPAEAVSPPPLAEGLGEGGRLQERSSPTGPLPSLPAQPGEGTAA